MLWMDLMPMYSGKSLKEGVELIKDVLMRGWPSEFK